MTALLKRALLHSTTYGGTGSGRHLLRLHLRQIKPFHNPTQWEKSTPRCVMGRKRMITVDKKTFYAQWANQAVQNTGYASCAPTENPVELFARMKNDMNHDRKLVVFNEFMTLQVPVISFQDWLTLIHVGRMVMDTKTEQGYLYNGNYTTLQTELVKRPGDVFSLITPSLEDYEEWYRQQDQPP